ncbi:hypothetical protein [uncultured Acetatifactor sp.]|jgi:hypothetical protein|uniref:hypothetical protein n=1 Tax=uncultured Acetatifactor sp. TaxID=1671927 RepID=UPI0026F3AB92|nr:hypothetical protein [uncultured Acetatifactor sp.]MCX4271629.1 hypothetical protein [Acetatifactor sp.]
MAKETGKSAGTAEKQAEAVQEPKNKPKAEKESVYPVGDLAANARKIFGTRQECVSAALRAAGKTECTVSEAKAIVEKFLKKEVK